MIKLHELFAWENQIMSALCMDEKMRSNLGMWFD